MTYYPPTKPSGTFTLVEGKYSVLDVGAVTPKEAGVIHHLLYLNVKYRTRSAVEAGKLTVRLVRDAWGGEPSDPTAYQTYPLPVALDDKGLMTSGGILITHTYFEVTERGRPVRWSVKVEGATGTISTRYRKATQ
jgi:hypothetical protein